MVYFLNFIASFVETSRSEQNFRLNESQFQNKFNVKRESTHIAINALFYILKRAGNVNGDHGLALWIFYRGAFAHKFAIRDVTFGEDQAVQPSFWIK